MGFSIYYNIIPRVVLRDYVDNGLLYPPQKFVHFIPIFKTQTPLTLYFGLRLIFYKRPIALYFGCGMFSGLSWFWSFWPELDRTEKSRKL